MFYEDFCIRKQRKDVPLVFLGHHRHPGERPSTKSCSRSGQMEQGQSLVSSDPEDCDLMQDGLEDRKYPGEVTSSSFKVKLQPKDSKKELLS